MKRNNTTTYGRKHQKVNEVLDTQAMVKRVLRRAATYGREDFVDTLKDKLFKMMDNDAANPLSKQDIIRCAIETSVKLGNKDIAKDLKTLLDDGTLDKDNEIKVDNNIVRFGTISFKKRITRGRKNVKYVDIPVQFDVLQHFPTREYILAETINGGVRAVILTQSKPEGEILPIIDEAIQRDIADFYNTPKFFTNNNWKAMLNDIQPMTRDEDNRPVRGDRRIAQIMKNGIKKYTGIDMKIHYFMATRKNIVNRTDAKETDYIYIGGFNISDVVRVRICRRVGANDAGMNIYDTYVRYGNYAFMMRIKYRMRQVTAYGGKMSGTAYKKLIKDKYLEFGFDKAPDKQSTCSDILNIYPFFKDLKNQKYEMADGKEVNMCDVILENISKIIQEKDLLVQKVFSKENLVYDAITIDNLKYEFLKAKDELDKARRKDKNASIASMNNIKPVAANTEDDGGFDDVE